VEVPPQAKAAPATWDWRQKNAVTPVKDQGQCGSCWAFSATETIESVWILAGKKTEILAPQQIVDCDTQDQGCNGGLPNDAFDYVKQCGGLDTEQSYPYTAHQGQCAFKKQDIGSTVTGYKMATSNGDETTLQASVSSVSPISIGVDAEQWQNYNGGVMTADQCGSKTDIDHAVQLIGYDTTANPPYWIVRNSWNTNWGIEGYIELEMHQDTCGITTMCSYATTSGTTGGASSSTGAAFEEF